MHVDLDPATAARHPEVRVATRVVDALRVRGANDPRALAILRDAERETRSHRTLDGLKDDPLFRAYRDFYWKLGIDPTKTRPSSEALNRRALAEKPLPTINSFVDAYNAASLLTGIPIGAYDLDQVEGALVLREARSGERFEPLAGDARNLAGGELVIADNARVTTYYPYRDCAHTRVTEQTTRAIIIACGAPGVEPHRLDEACTLAARNVTDACQP